MVLSRQMHLFNTFETTHNKSNISGRTNIIKKGLHNNQFAQYPIWLVLCCCICRLIGRTESTAVCGRWQSRMRFMFTITHQMRKISVLRIFSLVVQFRDTDWRTSTHGAARCMLLTPLYKLARNYHVGHLDLNVGYLLAWAIFIPVWSAVDSEFIYTR